MWKNVIISTAPIIITLNSFGEKDYPHIPVNNTNKYDILKKTNPVQLKLKGEIFNTLK